ncbi:FBD-associated F-box protein At5g56380-like [Silene latifolia]|uniref:FBD-associated F-box protein At5g56380-like n=1 Tax=Silene latifolia TaxID=37657 RepID=UPI003D77C083
MSGENEAKRQRGSVDRISELPEFILHHILSILDTKEAGRVIVLSKRWHYAWSSIPVLDFRPLYLKEFRDRPYDYDDDTVERFVGFIDKTLERYFMRKYRITKMYLELCKVDEKLKPLVDKWIMIAVQNQIQRLEIQINDLENKYKLPEILFCAKSLNYLKCEGAALPFYETMELVSLEYLILVPETVDDDMLQRIISSCPLVEIDISYYKCLTKISLPWMKKVNGGAESSGNGTMQSNLQEYPLQKFVCRGFLGELSWPWSMNVIALRNLRKLEFNSVPIRDDIISELSYGLVVLESLVLSGCFMLECINISSNSLKRLEISSNSELMKATIDAPKLLEFLCICDVRTSLSLIRAVDHCNAQFVSSCSYSTTIWLVKLKKFLLETNFFKSLLIRFHFVLDSSEIAFKEDQLRNAGTGVPYKLRELKLHGASSRNLTESSLLAFLNGLFWCCRPDVLSISTKSQDVVAKLILSILQEKAECWKDPLKNVEVESIEYPRLPSGLSVVLIRLRLSW